jgi:hypothetical protein
MTTKNYFLQNDFRQNCLGYNDSIQKKCWQNDFSQNEFIQNAIMQNAFIQNAFIQNAFLQNACTSLDDLPCCLFRCFRLIPPQRRRHRQ